MTGDRIQVLIAGGGVGGLSLAAALDRIGLDPVVVDRAETLDGPVGALELWPDTVTLLERLCHDGGLGDAGAPVATWSLRGSDGTVRRRLGSDDGPGFVGIRYGRLRERLRAGLPEGTVRTGTALRSIEHRDGRPVVGFGNGVREPFDLVVGADGVRSPTRRAAGGAPPVARGTASLAFPLDTDAAELDGASEVWTADGAVFRAIPTGDGPVGWLTVPNDGDGPAVGSTGGGADAGGEVELAVKTGIDWLLPEAFDAVGAGGTGDVWRDDDLAFASDAWTWTRTGGRIAFVGDAAHARHRLASVGPILAVEDALVLASEIGATDAPLAARLDRYAARRRARLRRLFRATERRPPLAGVASPLARRRPAVLDVRSARLDTSFRGRPPRPSVRLPEALAR